MKKHAFTLAEVLIVLGIIGVVAALTLPTLIANYQKQVLATQLKKSYSTMAQAIERVMHEEKATNFSETDFASSCMHGTSSWNCQNAINKYIKGSGSVYYYSKGNRSYPGLSCTWYSDYGSCSKSNSSSYDGYSYGNAITLPDGAIVYMNDGSITIDVNGQQKPNTFGRDLFAFSVNSETGELTPSGPTPNASQIIKDGWEMKY